MNEIVDDKTMLKRLEKQIEELKGQLVGGNYEELVKEKERMTLLEEEKLKVWVILVYWLFSLLGCCVPSECICSCSSSCLQAEEERRIMEKKLKNLEKFLLSSSPMSPHFGMFGPPSRGGEESGGADSPSSLSSSSSSLGTPARVRPALSLSLSLSYST